MTNDIVSTIEKYIGKECTILDAGEFGVALPSYLHDEYKNIDLLAREEVDCIRFRDYYRKTYHKDLIEYFYGDYDFVLLGNIHKRYDNATADLLFQYAQEHAKIGVQYDDGYWFRGNQEEEQPVKKPATRKRVKKDV